MLCVTFMTERSGNEAPGGVAPPPHRRTPGIVETLSAANPVQKPSKIAREDEPLLVAAAKRGDLSAFNELVGRYERKIFRLTMNITRNHEDAEDAMQDSFLSAFLHLENFDGRSTFSTWLTRIGIHSARVLRDIRDRHWRRRFSKLQNQLQL